MQNNEGGTSRTTETFYNGLYAFSNTYAQDPKGNTVATTTSNVSTLSNFSYYVVGSSGWVNTGKIASATMQISTGGTQITVTVPAAKTVPQTNVWFLLPNNTHGGDGFIDSAGQNGYVWPIGGSAYAGDYAHVSVNGLTAQTCIFVNNVQQGCGAINSLLVPGSSRVRRADGGSETGAAIGGLLTGLGNILQGIGLSGWGKIIQGGGQIITACSVIDCIGLLSQAGTQEFCSGEGFADADIMEYCSDNNLDFEDDDPIGGFDGGFDDGDGFVEDEL